MKIVLFCTRIKNNKKSSHPPFGAWSLLMVHIRFTPSQGPQGIENWFIQKSDYGNVTIEECPLTWDNFMVHDVNNPNMH